MSNSPDNVSTPVSRRKADSKDKRSSKKSKGSKSNLAGDADSGKISAPAGALESKEERPRASTVATTTGSSSSSKPTLANSSVIFSSSANSVPQIDRIQPSSNKDFDNSNLDHSKAEKHPSNTSPRPSHASSSTASPVSSSNTSSFATLPSATIMTNDPSNTIAHYGTASDFIMKTLIMDFREHTKKKLDDILKVGVSEKFLLDEVFESDPKIQQQFNSLTNMSQYHTSVIVDSLLKWRRNQLVEVIQMMVFKDVKKLTTKDLALVEERIRLAVEYIFARALLPILDSLTFRKAILDANFCNEIEEIAFSFFKAPKQSDDGDEDATMLGNRKKIPTLYAKVIGILSETRFKHIFPRFLKATTDTPVRSKKAVYVIHGIRYVRFFMESSDGVEQSIHFLNSLLKLFKAAQPIEVKQALSELIVKLLRHSICSINSSVDYNAWYQFHLQLFTSHSYHPKKGKYNKETVVLIPMVTSFLCSMKKGDFLENYREWLSRLYSALKEFKTRTVALENILLVLEMFFVKVGTDYQSALHVLLEEVGSIVLAYCTSKRPINDKSGDSLGIFVDLVHVMAQLSLPFAVEDVLFKLLSFNSSSSMTGSGSGGLGIGSRDSMSSTSFSANPTLVHSGSSSSLVPSGSFKDHSTSGSTKIKDIPSIDSSSSHATTTTSSIFSSLPFSSAFASAPNPYLFTPEKVIVAVRAIHSLRSADSLFIDKSSSKRLLTMPTKDFLTLVYNHSVQAIKTPPVAAALISPMPAAPSSNKKDSKFSDKEASDGTTTNISATPTTTTTTSTSSKEHTKSSKDKKDQTAEKSFLDQNSTSLTAPPPSSQSASSITISPYYSILGTRDSRIQALNPYWDLVTEHWAQILLHLDSILGSLLYSTSYKTLYDSIRPERDLIAIQLLQLLLSSIPTVIPKLAIPKLVHILVRYFIHLDKGIEEMATNALSHLMSARADFRPYIIAGVAEFAITLSHNRHDLIFTVLFKLGQLFKQWIDIMNPSNEYARANPLIQPSTPNELDVLPVSRIEGIAIIFLCSPKSKIRLVALEILKSVRQVFQSLRKLSHPIPNHHMFFNSSSSMSMIEGSRRGSVHDMSGNDLNKVSSLYGVNLHHNLHHHHNHHHDDPNHNIEMINSNSNITAPSGVSSPTSPMPTQNIHPSSPPSAIQITTAYGFMNSHIPNVAPTRIMDIIDEAGPYIIRTMQSDSRYFSLQAIPGSIKTIERLAARETRDDQWLWSHALGELLRHFFLLQPEPTLLAAYMIQPRLREVKPDEKELQDQDELLFWYRNYITLECVVLVPYMFQVVPPHGAFPPNTVILTSNSGGSNNGSITNPNSLNTSTSGNPRDSFSSSLTTSTTSISATAGGAPGGLGFPSSGVINNLGGFPQGRSSSEERISISMMNPSTSSSASFPKDTSSRDSKDLKDYHVVTILQPKDFYLMIIPGLKSSNDALRESCVMALQRTNFDSAAILAECLKSFEKDFQGEDKRKKQKRDRLRLDVTSIYTSIVEGARQLGLCKHTQLKQRIVAFINELQHFLKTNRNLFDMLQLRYQYCVIVSRVAEELHAARLNSPDFSQSKDEIAMRKNAVTLLSSWCSGDIFQEEGTKKHLNSLLSNIKDSEKRKAYVAALREHILVLQFSSFTAISSCLLGPHFEPILPENTFFEFVDGFLRHQLDKVRLLARFMLESFLGGNLSQPHVFEVTLEKCYHQDHEISSQYFLCLVQLFPEEETIATSEVVLLHLIIYMMGDSNFSVRRAAKELLLMLKSLSNSDEQWLTTVPFVVDSSLVDNYERAQIELSTKLSECHSFQATEMLSEMVLRMDVVSSNSKRQMLRSIIPWIEKLEFDQLCQQTVDLLMENLLFVTLNYKSDFPREIEQIWSTVARTNKNLQVVIRELIAIGMERQNTDIIPLAKLVCIYLARTASKVVVDTLVQKLSDGDPAGIRKSRRNSVTSRKQTIGGSSLGGSHSNSQTSLPPHAAELEALEAALNSNFAHSYGSNGSSANVSNNNSNNNTIASISNIGGAGKPGAEETKDKRSNSTTTDPKEGTSTTNRVRPRSMTVDTVPTSSATLSSATSTTAGVGTKSGSGSDHPSSKDKHGSQHHHASKSTTITGKVGEVADGTLTHNSNDPAASSVHARHTSFALPLDSIPQSSDSTSGSHPSAKTPKSHRRSESTDYHLPKVRIDLPNSSSTMVGSNTSKKAKQRSSETRPLPKDSGSKQLSNPTDHGNVNSMSGTTGSGTDPSVVPNISIIASNSGPTLPHNPSGHHSELKHSQERREGFLSPPLSSINSHNLSIDLNNTGITGLNSSFLNNIGNTNGANSMNNSGNLPASMYLEQDASITANGNMMLNGSVFGSNIQNLNEFKQQQHDKQNALLHLKLIPPSSSSAVPVSRSAARPRPKKSSVLPSLLSHLGSSDDEDSAGSESAEIEKNILNQATPLYRAIPISSNPWGLTRAHFILTILAQLTYEVAEQFREHLPIIFQLAFLGIDFPNALVYEHCRIILLNIIHSLIVLPLERLEFKSWAMQDRYNEALNLVEYMRSNQGEPLWAHEDVTMKNPEIKSAAQLTSLVQAITKAFSQSGNDLADKWASQALSWAVHGQSWHITGRSFQIYRALRPAITRDAQNELLECLLRSMAFKKKRNGSHVTSREHLSLTLEVLLTLQTLVRAQSSQKLILFPQMFWTSVALLHTDYEQHYLAALKLLSDLLDRLNFGDRYVQNIFSASIPKEWNPPFRGIQHLVARGLFSHTTDIQAIEVMSKMILIPYDEVLHPEPGRIFHLIICLLPFICSNIRNSSVSSIPGMTLRRQSSSISEQFSNACSQMRLPELSRIFAKFSRFEYDSIEEFISDFKRPFGVALSNLQNTMNNLSTPAAGSHDDPLAQHTAELLPINNSSSGNNNNNNNNGNNTNAPMQGLSSSGHTTTTTMGTLALASLNHPKDDGDDSHPPSPHSSMMLSASNNHISHLHHYFRLEDALSILFGMLDYSPSHWRRSTLLIIFALLQHRYPPANQTTGAVTGSTNSPSSGNSSSSQSNNNSTSTANVTHDALEKIMQPAWVVTLLKQMSSSSWQQAMLVLDLALQHSKNTVSEIDPFMIKLNIAPKSTMVKVFGSSAAATAHATGNKLGTSNGKQGEVFENRSSVGVASAALALDKILSTEHRKRSLTLEPSVLAIFDGWYSNNNQEKSINNKSLRSNHHHHHHVNKDNKELKDSGDNNRDQTTQGSIDNDRRDSSSNIEGNDNSDMEESTTLISTEDQISYLLQSPDSERDKKRSSGLEDSTFDTIPTSTNAATLGRFPTFRGFDELLTKLDSMPSSLMPTLNSKPSQLDFLSQQSEDDESSRVDEENSGSVRIKHDYDELDLDDEDSSSNMNRGEDSGDQYDDNEEDEFSYNISGTMRKKSLNSSSSVSKAKRPTKKSSSSSSRSTSTMRRKDSLPEQSLAESSVNEDDEDEHLPSSPSSNTMTSAALPSSNASIAKSSSKTPPAQRKNSHSPTATSSSSIINNNNNSSSIHSAFSAALTNAGNSDSSKISDSITSQNPSSYSNIKPSSNSKDDDPASTPTGSGKSSKPKAEKHTSLLSNESSKSQPASPKSSGKQHTSSTLKSSGNSNTASSSGKVKSSKTLTPLILQSDANTTESPPSSSSKKSDHQRQTKSSSSGTHGTSAPNSAKITRPKVSHQASTGSNQHASPSSVTSISSSKRDSKTAGSAVMKSAISKYPSGGFSDEEIESGGSIGRSGSNHIHHSPLSNRDGNGNSKGNQRSRNRPKLDFSFSNDFLNRTKRWRSLLQKEQDFIENFSASGVVLDSPSSSSKPKNSLSPKSSSIISDGVGNAANSGSNNSSSSNIILFDETMPTAFKMFTNAVNLLKSMRGDLDSCLTLYCRLVISNRLHHNHNNNNDSIFTSSSKKSSSSAFGKDTHFLSESKDSSSGTSTNLPHQILVELLERFQSKNMESHLPELPDLVVEMLPSKFKKLSKRDFHFPSIFQDQRNQFISEVNQIHLSYTERRIAVENIKSRLQELDLWANDDVTDSKHSIAKAKEKLSKEFAISVCQLYLVTLDSLRIQLSLFSILSPLLDNQSQEEAARKAEKAIIEEKEANQRQIAQLASFSIHVSSGSNMSNSGGNKDHSTGGGSNKDSSSSSVINSSISYNNNFNSSINNSNISIGQSSGANFQSNSHSGTSIGGISTSKKSKS